MAWSLTNRPQKNKEEMEQDLAWRLKTHPLLGSESKQRNSRAIFKLKQALGKTE